jgi:hypothetical protein
VVAQFVKNNMKEKHNAASSGREEDQTCSLAKFMLVPLASPSNPPTLPADGGKQRGC